MSVAEKNPSEESKIGIDSTNRGYLITPNPGEYEEHPDLIEFEGSEDQWKEFRQRIKEKGLEGKEKPLITSHKPFNFPSPKIDESFFAIPTLHPEIDSLESYSDLLQLEAEHQRTLDETVNSDGFGKTLSKTKETTERVKTSPHNNIEDWEDLLEENGKTVHQYPIEFDQKSKLFHRATEDIPVNNSHKRNKLKSLADSLNELESQELDQLFSYLKTNNHEIADTLFNISQKRYADLADNEAEAIRKILPSQENIFSQESPRVPEVFEEDSPYRQAVEEVYQELDEEIKELSHLAELQDEEFEPDLGVLKKWESERQGRWDAGLEEQDHEEKAEELSNDAKREIKKDISNLQRKYAKQQMERIGSGEIEKIYEDITGEHKSIEELEENPDVIYALRLRTDVGDGVENLERIIKNHKQPEQVYYLDTIEALKSLGNISDTTNNDWLDSQDYELKDLVDPNLEEYLEGPQFESSEEADSAFETYVEDIDEELTYKVANPLESLGMGNFADSCRSIGRDRPRAAVHDSVAPNRLTVYIEDEEQERKARVKAAITEDGSLAYRRKSGQNDMNTDLENETERYLEAVASNLGLKLEYNEDNEDINNRVELLSSKNFYWD